MSERNRSEGDVELLSTDGVTPILTLMLDPESDPQWKPGTPWSLASQLAAAVSDQPPAPRLTARYQGSFRRGIGLDYNAAYGLRTREGYVTPAGAATNVPVGSGPSASPFVAFCEYGGDLYVAQQGLGVAGSYGSVWRLPGGNGPLTLSMQIGVTNFLPGPTTGPVGASYYIRDLIVADDSTGILVLWASASDANGQNGVMYKYNGGNWICTNAIIGSAGSGSPNRGANRMAVEFMQPTASPGDWRILTITGPRTFSYTLPGADPQQPASWTADLKIGTADSLLEIAAARRKFWLTAVDNLYEVDDLGSSSGLTSYMRAQRQVGNALAALYMHGYVYLSLGRGLTRVKVDQSSILDEAPGHCSPGWNTPAENRIRGFVTAMTPDQGGILANVFNPSTGESFVCWGVDRALVNIDSPNPMVWHGPEVCMSGGFRINRMLTSGLSGDLRLWLASYTTAPITGAIGPRLDWVSLPVAGSPIQDLMSSGSMKFANGAGLGVIQSKCQLELLRDGWDDLGASNHILYQDTVVSRGLSITPGAGGLPPADDGAGTRLDLYSRADPLPSAPDGTWTFTHAITDSPAQTVTQPDSGVIQGHFTQARIDFISPNGDGHLPTPGSPPKVGVLDSIRRMGWVEVPTLRSVDLPVRYGDGVTVNQSTDPDEISLTLKSLTEGTKIQYLDYWGKRWVLKLDQVLNMVEEVDTGGEWDKRVRCTLRGSLIGAPL